MVSSDMQYYFKIKSFWILPSIIFISLFSPLFISLQVQLMLLCWLKDLALKFRGRVNNFIRGQYSFGNSPTSIQASDLDLLAEQVSLHLHEFLIDSHSSVHDYFGYFVKLFVFNIIEQPISNGIQDSFQDMLSFCIEVQSDDAALHICSPIWRKDTPK